MQQQSFRVFQCSVWLLDHSHSQPSGSKALWNMPVIDFPRDQGLKTENEPMLKLCLYSGKLVLIAQLTKHLSRDSSHCPQSTAEEWEPRAWCWASSGWRKAGMDGRMQAVCPVSLMLPRGGASSFVLLWGLLLLGLCLYCRGGAVCATPVIQDWCPLAWDSSEHGHGARGHLFFLQLQIWERNESFI